MTKHESLSGYQKGSQCFITYTAVLTRSVLSWNSKREDHPAIAANNFSNNLKALSSGTLQK